MSHLWGFILLIFVFSNVYASTLGRTLDLKDENLGTKFSYQFVCQTYSGADCNLAELVEQRFTLSENKEWHLVQQERITSFRFPTDDELSRDEKMALILNLVKKDLIKGAYGKFFREFHDKNYYLTYLWDEYVETNLVTGFCLIADIVKFPFLFGYDLFNGKSLSENGDRVLRDFEMTLSLIQEMIEGRDDEWINFEGTSSLKSVRSTLVDKFKYLGNITVSAYENNDF